MVKRLLSLFFAYLFITFMLSSSAGLHSAKGFTTPSERFSPPQVKKKKADYMSRVLSRNTNPLGLREDPELKKLTNQPSIKWAIRADQRHILH